MTRKEFLKLCGIFGIGVPFANTLMACQTEEALLNPFSGKVLIIGAGAGGLSAGYFLQQQGTEFEILEASPGFGGRMKINTDFADFPIPLGAEWLETNTGIFKEIINDSSVQLTIQTVEDAPDRKFVNYSWFNFFEDYIVPSVSGKITFNTVVQSIDYSGKQVIVSTQQRQYVADKVIISVPLALLKEGSIEFNPPLPASKLKAIDESIIWAGFKAFFEFSSPFYGEGLEIISNEEGEKIYYNAAFGQNTSKHILGLFAVGQPALDYIHLPENQIKAKILQELDGLYNHQASSGYIKHIMQNWNDEPYIKGAYMTDFADWRTVRELGRSVSDRLFFAGGAYTDGEDWVSVHTAAQSARKAIREINAS
jgi:monoamine oxidase